VFALSVAGSSQRPLLYGLEDGPMHGFVFGFDLNGQIAMLWLDVELSQLVFVVFHFEIRKLQPVRRGYYDHPALGVDMPGCDHFAQCC
jgi:hypothetical protein